jgi:hypothetical protein
MSTAATSKTYAFAIVPTQGMYGSGDIVRVARLSNDLDAARKIAKKLTAEYRQAMRPHGGSSGGYRVIVWGAADRTASGYWINHCPDAK